MLQPVRSPASREVDPSAPVTQIMIAPSTTGDPREEIATLDIRHRGRLEFGLGLGYRAEEFD